MLTTEQNTLLQQLVQQSNRESLSWINGYLTGLLSGQQPVTANSPKAFGGKLTLLYGTETGNAKYLANKLAGIARQAGITVKATAAEQYKIANLDKEKYLLVIISTQGDGEPPVAAIPLYNALQHSSLPKLNYAVIGLGDSSYPMFCQTGKDIDGFLEASGATKIQPLLTCDTDFETPAEQWFQSLLELLNKGSATPGLMHSEPATLTKKTATGRIISNINLNDTGSAKQTHHIEIATDGLQYAPGDSISIVPLNPALAVTHIIEQLGATPDSLWKHGDENHGLFDLLQQKTNISWLPERFVARYAQITGLDIPATRLSLADLIRIYPPETQQQKEELVMALEPIAPRQYSIASSPAAHEEELHLIVAKDCFAVNGLQQYGLCSNYLTDLAEDTELVMKVHPNRSFRLPDDDKDIIMIGPGTGIAPFRSFLHERETTMATGRNWLFFGDRNFESDFLYQTEIQAWIESGLLNRFNAAFSRDQEEKIYVQHRMWEQRRELFNWLEAGASLYICGAKYPMSTDVEQTLLDIISSEGNIDAAAAKDYLAKLSDENRYLKDVY